MAVRVRVALVLLVCAGFSSPAPASSAGAEGTEFFEKSIRPILVERCYSCHSAQAEKVRGSLLLDSKGGWEKGGDLGPSIEPGDPEGSLLIEAVRYKDESLRMPPKGKLADREIELLTRWVAMGAPDPRTSDAVASRPRGVDPEQGREFWAFRAPEDPTVPAVEGTEWPRSPLDH